MEGPFDPQPPDHDAGPTQPAGQDGDLHALLERLLGQGDVRPAEAGAGDDLWPELFAASAPLPDDVSTIIPAPEVPSAVAELPAAVDEPLGASHAVPAETWEPVVETAPAAAASTNVDDIHAAILASVSVDLEPIARPVPETPAVTVDPPAAAPVAFAPVSFDAAMFENAAPGASDPAAFDLDTFDAATFDSGTFDSGTFDSGSFDSAAFEALGTDPAHDASADHASAFALTPFEAHAAETPADAALDAEALWAAAVPGLGSELGPELGLDVAPQLDLDGDEEPAGTTAVVLPWPTHEARPAEVPAAPQDLIEAALAGLHADLTAEPVEPLRTPDVAASTAHVVFRLGKRIMAIPLAAVSEIARPPKVTRLPHVPAWVLGIANLRGDIVSMLDLEGFFSGKPGQTSHEQRMLALRPSGDEVRTAVLVDSVDGIQAFEDARIARVTRGYDAEVAPYARGLYQLEDELVVVVDADRLLQSKPMRQFEDGAGAR